MLASIAINHARNARACAGIRGPVCTCTTSRRWLLGHGHPETFLHRHSLYATERERSIHRQHDIAYYVHTRICMYIQYVYIHEANYATAVQLRNGHAKQAGVLRVATVSIPNKAFFSNHHHHHTDFLK